MKWNKRELDPSKSEWDVWIFVVGFANCLVINPSLSATIYVSTLLDFHNETSYFLEHNELQAWIAICFGMRWLIHIQTRVILLCLYK